MLKNSETNQSYGSTEEDPTFNVSPTPPSATLGCYTRFDSEGVRNESRRRGCRHCGVSDDGGLKILVLCMFILATAVTVILLLQINYGYSASELSSFQRTTADDPKCSDLGDRVMALGGNAVDAVVATTSCMSLVAPHLTGIGGGGFMLIHQRRLEKTVILDFRETAPKSARNDRFMANPERINVGRNSIGVPGFLKGLEKAHREFGSASSCCTWEALIRMSIDAVGKEFILTEHFINASINKISKPEMNAKDSINLKEFIRPSQKLIPGQKHKSHLFKRLVKVYESLAAEGSDAFYFGSVGEKIVKELNGLVSKEDLASYEVKTRDPVKISLAKSGYDVYASGPPSSGPKLLAFLNAIEALVNERNVDIWTPEYFKKLFVIADRLQRSTYRIGDPLDPEVDRHVKTMLDKSTGLRLISDVTESDEYREYPSSDPGGVYIAAMDSKDVYVSSVTSLNAFFGSKFMTSDGILLNNALENFDIPQFDDNPENLSNRLSEGRRPVSSSALALVVNSKEICGSRILIGGASAFDVAQVLSETLLYGSELKSAINYPRIRVSNESIGVEMVYDEFDPKVLADFARFHPYRIQHLPYNAVNAINKTDDLVETIRDPRSGHLDGLF